MTDYIITFFQNVWFTTCEMAPFLLFGFIVAGILSGVLSTRLVARHLGGHGLLPVVKASLFGIPLPLCSCSVIPVTVSLRERGASQSAALSFLLSTPQTGVDSVLVTYGLLGPVFAVFRPIAAFFTGIVGGSLLEIVERDSDDGAAESSSHASHHDACCGEDRKGSRIRGMAHHAFIALPQDLALPLIVGVLVAGGIAAFVPDDFFVAHVSSGIPAMLMMMLVGIPLYVCTTASVPIAAALILKGLSPGAALVFLITGAATNAAGISVIWKTMGTRAILVYMGSVIVCAFLSGFALNIIFASLEIPARQAVSHSGMLPDAVKVASALVLIVLFIRGIAARVLARNHRL